jgi:hypothetical protein
MFKSLKTLWQNLLKEQRKSPWFALSVSHELVLGEPCRFAMSSSTDIRFTPEQLHLNVPCMGLVLVHEVKICNVSMTVGTGAIDAIAYSKGEMRLGGFEMYPANRVSLICEYTGYVPEQYVAGQKYTFSATFKGPGKTF